MNQPAAILKCDLCGATLPPDAPLGQCPGCLMDSVTEGASGEDLDLPQELPRQCGDYELLRQIGCGGMGLVYEARQMHLKRRVALKMIRPDLASRKFLRRFLVEGEAAARLDHPNIIPIYEIKENGPESFFSMQFIEGETLKERMRHGVIGLKGSAGASGEEVQARATAIARLIANVARAVHHAHERGVFHRDLKPGNILIDAELEPHIADFGVAKILREEGRTDAESSLTMPGATLGTPEYMAPEQAAGTVLSKTASIAAADIYSLGAILYELLTGKPPFHGDSHLETLQKVREGDLKRPHVVNPVVPRDLETICLKCLEKNPQARYVTSEALANDLERWLAGKPIAARPVSVPVRVQRWVKRNRVGTALIVSLFFGLGAALSLLAVLADRMRTEEVNEALEREALLQIINDRWSLPAITNMVIPYTLLAELRNQPPRAWIEGRDVRLKFGMSVDEDPVTRAHNVAALLGELEQKMGQELGRNVFFDLHLSKATHLEVQLLSTREADVQRMDALTYLRAKARDPGVVPVAIENEADEIVFCVPLHSSISNLAQIKGKSLGFGDMNSAATVLAQFALLTNGIRQSGLRSVEYITNVFVVSTTRLPELGSAEYTTDMREVKSGREALRHLLQGKLDAAVTLKRYFELRRHRGGGLRIVGKLPGSPEVFAARSGLEPEVVRAFGNAMLSIKQSPGLSTISSFRTVSGVTQANDSHFDGLRHALTNVLEHFQGETAPESR